MIIIDWIRGLLCEDVAIKPWKEKLKSHNSFPGPFLAKREEKEIINKRETK